jgi:hypothetical protein
MTSLIYNKETREVLAKLKLHAEERPFMEDELRAIKDGLKLPAGDQNGYFAFIPEGIKVVFTHEILAGYRVKHASFSQANGVLPNERIVEILVQLLGIKGKMEDLYGYVEGNSIVNVIEIPKAMFDYFSKLTPKESEYVKS